MLPRLSALAVWAIGPAVYARLEAVAIAPHGDFALDPSLIKGVNGSDIVHNASLALGGLLVDLQPDFILLSSPHGIALANDFGLYLSSNASGFALIGSDLHNASWPGYPVYMDFPLQSGVMTTLSSTLARQGWNVSGILPWGDSEPIGIRWGEVVPLWFMKQYVNATSSGSPVWSHPTVGLWSQPLRRYTAGVQAAMVPELLGTGAALFDFLEALPGTTVLVISADQSHVHPNPVQPYGANATAAALFESAVGDWLKTGNGTRLTADAAQVADSAMSCGFTGMVLAQGAVSRCTELQASRPCWSPTLYALEAPTYYGMAVGAFWRSQA